MNSLHRIRTAIRRWPAMAALALVIALGQFGALSHALAHAGSIASGQEAPGDGLAPGEACHACVAYATFGAAAAGCPTPRPVDTAAVEARPVGEFPSVARLPGVVARARAPPFVPA